MSIRRSALATESLWPPGAGTAVTCGTPDVHPSTIAKGGTLLHEGSAAGWDAGRIGAYAITKEPFRYYRHGDTGGAGVETAGYMLGHGATTYPGTALGRLVS